MRRDKRFTFLLSDLEYDQLTRLADYHRRGRSDLVRWLIQTNAEQVGIFRLKADTKDRETNYKNMR